MLKNYKVSVLLNMKTAGFGKGLQAKLKGLRRNLKKIGEGFKQVRMYSVFAGAALIKTAADYETAFSGFLIKVAKLGPVTKKVREEFDQLFRGIAKSSILSALQVAKLADGLSESGFSLMEIKKSLQTFVDFSIAAGKGEVDPSTLIYSVRSTLRAFDLDLTKAGEVANKILKTATLGQLKIADIAETISGSVFIAGKQMKMNINQYLEMLLLMSDASIKGSRAATAFKNYQKSVDVAINQKLGSKEGRLFKKMGFTIAELKDAKGNYKNFAIVFEKFREKFREGVLSPIDFSVLFGLRAKTGALGILSADEKRILKIREVLTGSFDALTHAADLYKKSVTGTFQITTSSFTEMSIAFMKSGLAEELKGILRHLQDLFNHLAKVSPATKKWIAYTTVLTIVLPSLCAAISILTFTLSVLAIKITAVVALIAFLPFVWDDAVERFGPGIDLLTNWLKKGWIDFENQLTVSAGVLEKVWGSVLDWFTQAWEDVTSAIEKAINTLQFWKTGKEEVATAHTKVSFVDGEMQPVGGFRRQDNRPPKVQVEIDFKNKPKDVEVCIPNFNQVLANDNLGRFVLTGE